MENTPTVPETVALWVDPLMVTETTSPATGYFTTGPAVLTVPLKVIDGAP